MERNLDLTIRLDGAVCVVSIRDLESGDLSQIAVPDIFPLHNSEISDFVGNQILDWINVMSEERR